MKKALILDREGWKRLNNLIQSLFSIELIPGGCYDPNTGQVGKHAFLPTRPEDDHQLSVSDSRRITAKSLYRRYAADPSKLPPDGVMAVKPKDCHEKNLPVREDPLPDAPDHVLIDFRGLFQRSKNRAQKAAAYLRDRARETGAALGSETSTVEARATRPNLRSFSFGSCLPSS